MEIYLGEPPADIKQWIIDHAGPAGHAETIFTLQDGTVKTHDIPGPLDQQWMITNGYWDSENYKWLKTITQADIGNTVTSIGEDTFSGCSGLTSVTIPGSVISVGYGAFRYCGALTDVTIHGSDNMTSIDGYAFSSCWRLTSVTIGNGVTSIGNNAFYDCGELPSVIFRGKDKATVQDMSNYSWGLPFGCVLRCEDGNITIEI